MSTWNAMDIFPYDYKGNMGRPGVVAERFSNFAVQNCDLLISIGSRLNNTLTAYNPEGFGKSAKKIIIDIDPNELKLNKMKNTIKICADAKVFIEDLLDKCAFSSLEVDWIDLLERWKLDFSLQKEEKAKKSDYIGHYDAVLSLSKSIPEDRIIVTGSSGLAVEAFYVAFKNKANQRILHTSGLGSMGYAVPAAIGVSFEKRTSENALYCVEGDGSLHMNIQDIGTLKSSGQKVCLIILNNKGYASIRATQKGYFEGRYFGTGPEGGNSFVEMSKLAKLFDYRYLPATSTKEIAAAIQEFEINDSCVLLDIKIQKNESLYPKSSVYFTEDGKMHSMPLEDMTPLLALDTLKKEMTFELNQASYKARED